MMTNVGTESYDPVDTGARSSRDEDAVMYDETQNRQLELENQELKSELRTAEGTTFKTQDNVDKLLRARTELMQYNENLSQ